jgi:RND family efflux transporter MFP subunit
MPGVVTSIYVKAGDKVSKGTVLATLDAETVRKQLEEVQLQADFLKTVFDKQKTLWDQKVGSEMQFIKAKTDYEAMNKRMLTLQEQLAMASIKSPINGVVDEVSIKVGQTVAPMVPAFHVVNLAGLKVEAEVAEAYVAKVNKNDEVIVELPDIDKQIKTKLSYSGQVIDPLNRTFNVEAALSSSEKGLHPNMIAILKIVDYKNPKAFTVPVNVIQSGMEGTYLYVAEKENNRNVAKRRLVKTGESYNGFVEVIAGLKEGDKVITTGYQDLLEGESLKF